MEQDPVVVLIFQGSTDKPAREGLEHTSILSEDLYRRRPPDVESINILLPPAAIADGPSEEDKIAV